MNSVWKLSRPRLLNKEKQNVMRREGGQTQTLNYLSRFNCSSNHACSLVSSSQLHVWCETPFQSSPRNRGGNFRLSSHRCVWCPTNCFCLVSSGRWLTLSWVFSPITALPAFSFEFLPWRKQYQILVFRSLLGSVMFVSVFSLKLDSSISWILIGDGNRTHFR